MLAPGAPDDPLQWIDVRDLADWLVTLVEHGTAGDVQRDRTAQPARWGDVLEACVDAPAAARSSCGCRRPGSSRTAWAAKTRSRSGSRRPASSPAFTAGTTSARGAGLTFRPIADTVGAILAWYPGELERRVRVATKPTPDPRVLRAGPTREREAELLAQFRAG